MPYIPAGRKQAVRLVAIMIAGLLCAAPAIAKAPPKPKPGSTTTTSTYADASNAINAYLASTNISASSCTDPSLTQPFVGWADSNYYALAPGQSDSNFTGTNWYLMNGATITTTTLNDGSTGSVLDMPSGSLAISPPMCVAYNYPTARTMVRTLSGTGGVDVYVAYFNGTSYQVTNGGSAGATGSSTSSAWGLSDQINLNPSTTSGWQIARFALYASGSGEYQLYNFYVDPYAKR
jgi:hypothetical protein